MSSPAGSSSVPSEGRQELEFSDDDVQNPWSRRSGDPHHHETLEAASTVAEADVYVDDEEEEEDREAVGDESDSESELSYDPDVESSTMHREAVFQTGLGYAASETATGSSSSGHSHYSQLQHVQQVSALLFLFKESDCF